MAELIFSPGPSLREQLPWQCDVTGRLSPCFMGRWHVWGRGEVSNLCCHVSPFPLCACASVPSPPHGNTLGTMRSLWAQTGAVLAPWAKVTVEGRRSGGEVSPALRRGAGTGDSSLPSPESLAGSLWALLLAERLAMMSETSQGAQRNGGLEKELAVISKGTSEAED